MEGLKQDEFGYFYIPIPQDILDKYESNLMEYIDILKNDLRIKNERLNRIPMWIQYIFNL